MGVETLIVALAGNTFQFDKSLFFETGVMIFKQSLCLETDSCNYELDMVLTVVLTTKKVSL
jgi:hypothetical protein